MRTRQTDRRAATAVAATFIEICHEETTDEEPEP